MVILGKEITVKGFIINLGYIRTGFKNLISISTDYFWDSELQKGVWTFPLSKKDEVEELVGQPISIDGNPMDAASKIIVPDVERKSRGVFEIVFRSPKFYRIKTTVGKKQVRVLDVSLPIVMELWNLIDEELDQDESITTPVLAEKLMTRLKITRFHRESGSFDWSKFFGTRGAERDKGYFVYLYYPLKCLHAEGAINYKGSERVTKLKDDFHIQTEFKPIKMEGDN